MKKNILYILMLFSVALFSCEDEDAVRVPEVTKAANVRIQVDPEFSFFDLGDIQSAKVVYDMFSENNNIESIEISVTYYNLAGDTLGPEVAKSYTQNDLDANDGVLRDQEISAAQVATLLGIDISSFDGGDRIEFSNTTSLTNGLVFPQEVILGEDTVVNIEPSIISTPTASFTPGFTAFVGCPSPQEDIVGTYSASAVVTQGFGIPPNISLENVTIRFVGPEPFRYRVSSHDAGWWGTNLGAEGGGADFFDICGTIIMQPVASFGYGGAADNGGGSYDPATGIITLNWFNSFNNIAGEVVYTPAD